MAAQMFDEIIEKFNPYHDRLGRFASAGAAASFTYAPGRSNAHDKAIERERAAGAAGAASDDEQETDSKWADSLEEERANVLAMSTERQAEYVFMNDGETMDNCVAAMENGQTEALVNNYFSIMRENGNPAPTNPTSDQLNGQLKRDVDSGKFDGYEEARTGYIKEMSGLSDAEAQTTMKEFNKWFGGNWTSADTATIDRYVERDHVYDGKIYRGMKFDNADFDTFMRDVSPGAQIHMLRNSSWSSEESVARTFGAHGYDDINTVMITCVKNRTSAPVAHLSHQGEAEVIAHSKAKWTVLHSEVVEWPSGAKKAYLTVVETGE